MLRIILLFSIFLIGCVSTGKYEELKNSCEQKEKTCQEELKLEKEKFAKLLEEQKNEIAKLTENHNNELKVKQEKYNDLLRQKLSLRTSINQMEGSVDELSQEKANLEKQKQEMEQALEELRKRKEESEARVTEFKGLLDKFKAFIDTGKLKIKIIDGRMVIVLSSDVLFASGSKVLSTNGKKAVAEVTEILAKIENRKFQIEGHTDSDRLMTIGQTNWDLAADRAINVLNTMIKSGMPETKISAASFGDSRPIVPNTTKANKAQNRRIEIVVVPDLSLLPGYEDLQKMANEVSK
ncbi:MAG: OmpA family protein [Leptospiraceae bacterium]|nr:OmpA family protein [Leptospiraceae bacterium]